MKRIACNNIENDKSDPEEARSVYWEQNKVTLDPSACASPTLPVFSLHTEEELYQIPAIPTAAEIAFQLLMAPNFLDCSVR